MSDENKNTPETGPAPEAPAAPDRSDSNAEMERKLSLSEKLERHIHRIQSLSEPFAVPRWALLQWVAEDRQDRGVSPRAVTYRDLKKPRAQLAKLAGLPRGRAIPLDYVGTKYSELLAEEKEAYERGELIGLYDDCHPLCLDQILAQGTIKGPAFWRDLQAQFEGLDEKLSRARLQISGVWSPTQWDDRIGHWRIESRSRTGHWRIESHGNESAKGVLLALAEKGVHGLKTDRQGALSAVWLDLVRQEENTTKKKTTGYEASFGARRKTWEIRICNLPEASAAFCVRLEAIAVGAQRNQAARPETAGDRSGKRPGEKRPPRRACHLEQLCAEIGWSYADLYEETGIDRKLIRGHVQGKGVGYKNLCLYAKAFTEKLGREVTVADVQGIASGDGQQAHRLEPRECQPESTPKVPRFYS